MILKAHNLRFVLWCLPVLLLLSCAEDSSESILEETQADRTPEVVPAKNGTEQMAQELRQLVVNGNPAEYYHWNSKFAAVLKSHMKEGTPQQQMNTWFEYCKQTLNAGNSQLCIDELMTYFDYSGQPLAAQLNDQNKVMFELLALAHLRLGEQENCQHHHTPQSCILPLQKEGQHQLPAGSEKAIELYTLLQERFPHPKYQWLLNVAYMTLGKQAPQKDRIAYPQSNEQADFPRFEEVAMFMGLAQDGLSGGTCIDDFNNDGWLDIFATSYGMEDNVQLFLNDGQGGFYNATEAAGLTGIVSGLNCIHADYDNDGNKDILLLRGAWLGKAGKHPNSLLRGNGDGTFEDVTHASGIISHHPTQTAAWGDFNNDGWLDLFIGNESRQGDPHPCELFKNNGDGTFTEVAAQHGLGGINAFIKGVTWGDINNDGWPELYVSVVEGKNRLYRNEQGHFVEITDKANVGEPFFSFPCWFWDVNNDGYQDLFVSGYDLRYLEEAGGEFARELTGQELLGATPRLYINNGDETFTDNTEAYGLAKSMFSMGANFGDLDNDGFLDFYVGTGAPDFTTIVPNRMFRNVNGERFEEVTSAGNFGHLQKGHGIAFADLDQDGDQDIYAVMGGAFEGDNFTNILYENPISKHNWIVIELKGVSNNSNGIGARIELQLNNGQSIYRTVSTGGSFGASSLQQEIGLGQASLISSMTIYWNNGKQQVFQDVAVNQKVLVVENQEALQVITYNAVPFAKAQQQHHHH